MSWVYDRVKQCYVFQEGGIIPKYQNGRDFLKQQIIARQDNTYVAPKRPILDLQLPQQSTQPNQPYFPSDEILNYIKSTEAFHDGWKKDGNGNPTTGWGFIQTDELKRRFPNGMTRQQADDYFINEAIPYRVQRLQELTPNWDKLNQNQRDALFDYLYNIGEGSYTTGSPGLQRALKALNHQEIVSQMDYGYKDTKNPGLKTRRDYERKLYNTPVK